MSARVLVLAGSLRTGSYNRLLAAEAARLLSLTSATLVFIDLADYPLPIYDGDLEAGGSGIPPAAVQLAERFAGQDGLLIVSPEYNASIPPLLKNALDWASRVNSAAGRPVKPFARLVVGLASASPGRLGGLRGLSALRIVFEALGAEVLTRQLAVPQADRAFNADGRLIDERLRASLDALLQDLVVHAQLLGRNQP